MFYTVYKTTNLLNGKFYIGKHKTKDLNDGYTGSGKLLMRAIKKHGVEKFRTEIIAIYEHEWQMNLAERILAVVDSEVSYNLCSGGRGGFGFINKNKLYLTDKNIEVRRKNGLNTFKKLNARLKENPEYRQVWIAAIKAGLKASSTVRVCAPTLGMLGKTHSLKSKERMRSKKVGKLNTSFGLSWITNGKENKRKKAGDPMPVGFRFGRRANLFVRKVK